MTTPVARQRLDHLEVERVRHTPGRSALLFITDRCPVSCAHCSVDSRADSQVISDWPLFDEILDWLCGTDAIELVGISGGEPFVERRGLSSASRRLAEAGKSQVIYTSGVWAAGASPAPWIHEILARCSCVYLSTDAFHAPGVADEKFVRAATAIAQAGTWIVVQVVDSGDAVQRAHDLLAAAFGPHVDDHAELRALQPLNTGRGADVFAPRPASTPGHSFGPCPLVTAPVIRYDGTLTACCNEAVIMGRGPGRLRRRSTSRVGLEQAMTELQDDPIIHAIGDAGLGALTAVPRFSHLADQAFADICQLCWRLLDQEPESPSPDPIVSAVNEISRLERRW